MTRGQLLERNESAQNNAVARYMISLAATIDPRNEDAIYEEEIRRIDNGEVSWKTLTEGKAVAVKP